jgi:ribosomal protein S27E
MPDRFMKNTDHCLDPERLYCALHCPYCGNEHVMLDLPEQRVSCPSCGHAETLAHSAFILRRRQQVMELSGFTVQEWKAKARQLSTRFRYRWRSAMSYLSPAVSAALSRCDDLVICGWTEEEAMLRAKADLPELERFVAANPQAGSDWAEENAPTFLEDWF